MAHTDPPERDRPERRLPVGYGLLIALAVSVALWSGLVWLLGRS
ncbi:hypothetical protein [Phenylobacterium sp.]|nr:hypothetical protein [Phenylobacterium sp.]HVI31071.1 hypothetical protein [Phenylobacterium sp.]